MEDIDKIHLFEYEIYSGTKKNLIEKLKNDLIEARRNVVFAINPLKIMAANESSNVKRVLHNADILIPDGVGILYAAKKKKVLIKERIPGIELMHEMCRLSVDTASSIFIYGSSQENLERAVDNLKTMYRGINISGYLNGYENDKDKVIKNIRESKANILFVALGSPMQEILIDEIKKDLTEVKFFLGVGGSVDVISGNVKRAPEWVIRGNFEWLYRIIYKKNRWAQLKKIIEYIFLLKTV